MSVAYLFRQVTANIWQPNTLCTVPHPSTRPSNHLPVKARHTLMHEGGVYLTALKDGHRQLQQTGQFIENGGGGGVDPGLVMAIKRWQQEVLAAGT